MSGPKRRRPRIGLTPWKRPVHTIVGGPEQLFTLAEEYVECVRRSGGIPIILPPAPLNAAADAVASVDALVLTGGGDFSPSSYTGQDEGVSADIDLQEDAWDVALTLAARDAGLPFFGICRGMQALNIALGGTLYQDISDRPNHPPVPGVPADAVAFRHPVTIQAESRLGRILGVIERSVNSIHPPSGGPPGRGARPRRPRSGRNHRGGRIQRGFSGSGLALPGGAVAPGADGERPRPAHLRRGGADGGRAKRERGLGTAGLQAGTASQRLAPPGKGLRRAARGACGVEQEAGLTRK